MPLSKNELTPNFHFKYVHYHFKLNLALTYKLFLRWNVYFTAFEQMYSDVHLRPYQMSNIEFFEKIFHG